MGSTKTDTPRQAPPTPGNGGGSGADLRRMSEVRAVVRAWRELTAGAASTRTVIACSGGADSGALALALATATADLVIAHIVHDMRPAPEALADRDRTRALAERLGLPFAEASVRCAEKGNAEATARNARYLALTRIAIEAGAPFVATGHHADDQLESMIMGLMRGAGPRGLAGAAPSRPLDAGVTLLRPMLELERAQAEAICSAAGYEWAIDATNSAMTRGLLRAGPIAELKTHRAGAAARAARTAEHMRDAAQLLDERVAQVFGEQRRWARSDLRKETALVVGEGLRRAALALSAGQGADRLSARVVDPAVRAVRDDSTETREFTWKLRAATALVTVGARSVSVEAV